MPELDSTPGIRPRPTLRRRADATARHAFPVACTVVLMVLAHAPLGIPDQAALLPSVTIIAVFFWSVFRPAAVPPPAVFLLGLGLDLLGWLPLGVGPAVLLLVQAFCLRWRRGLARQPFLLIWAVFAGFAAVAAALVWGAASLLSLRLLPFQAALFQAVLAAALYPALAIPLALAHRTIADPEQA